MEASLTVLAVDDNRDNLMVLRALMKDYLPSARVLTALSGAEGLALARSEDPDVALLDISMPGMDGFDVCQKLKSDEQLSNIPVVFLTAVRTDSSARIRALELGAEGFLARPMDEYALIAQVRAMAKLKAANRRQRREKVALAELVEARTHEVQAQRDQLQGLLLSVPSAIARFDEQGCVVMANPGTGEIFGEDARLLIGRSADDLLHCPACVTPPGVQPPRSRAGLCSAIHEAIAGRSVRDREIEDELAPGTGPRQLLCNAEPITVNGKPGAVLVLRDISELRRVQREQAQLQAKLAQTDRLMNMGLLAASVAHEVNNPLSFVLSNLETLSEDLPKMAACLRKTQEALVHAVGAAGVARTLANELEAFGPTFTDDAVARLQEALVGTQRIRRIIRGLSTFSHAEGTAPEPVDVLVSLEHALTVSMNEIRHRARVVKELGPVPPVLAFEGKLAQVLLNLLVNAAHAIEDGKPDQNEIRVRTREERGAVFIEIADTGKGIAPEHRKQVFEPFFTTKGVGLGSGLGLWISRNIVVELGGELDFESEVGKGTRFFVKLPAMQATAKAPSASAAAGSDAVMKPSVRGRVLVIDDEPGVRTLLARILGVTHEVITASSGAEAKKLLAQPARFDAVVCDLMMPEVSGMEVHAWLQERDPSLASRLVFVTGGVFTRSAADYLEKVPNPRVEKPFEAAALRAVVGEMVNRALSEAPATKA
jgi:signal transduction histidine kinase/response regulator RpfG family c-di-GMP phosphodiesterase